MTTDCEKLAEDAKSFEEFVIKYARQIFQNYKLTGNKHERFPDFTEFNNEPGKEMAIRKKKLRKLKEMNLGELLKISKEEASKEFLREKEYWERRVKELEAEIEISRNMLEKIEGWTPFQGEVHQKLRFAMIRQLEKILGDKINDREVALVHLGRIELETPERHFCSKLLSILACLEDDRQEDKKEIDRVQNTQVWYYELLESLGITWREADRMLRED